MEGEKETAEEKEEDEEEKLNHIPAQRACPDLPIMHWEDLSQRIAELEKQEQERMESSKKGAGGRMAYGQGGVWTDMWEEKQEEFRRCRVAQRFHNHRNLQLCFINNSDSEDEEDACRKKDCGGLKQEVVTALRTLRDKLLAEEKQKQHLSSSSIVAKRKHLESWELQECSLEQLISLKASLQQGVHALSSELVTHLLVRDQLRTKQDAMLLDVQDLT
ncbi:schwannomin-interacting protein 1 isoform X1 [Takifugu flavidus]|uniref:Schwannomin interacting protein 1 C-terminal domain-containing protein n=1 Tax=Takifugu flavidus TaxID=433684 RepID=A0A5C6P601_9TELE|nr:schwannomin-interacting protein 1 isoform X1 [Takifugu flavidus]TWW74546.1 hypothetical protein D4764_14G0005490 [Takifugu flavidus]